MCVALLDRKHQEKDEREPSLKVNKRPDGNELNGDYNPKLLILRSYDNQNLFALPKYVHGYIPDITLHDNRQSSHPNKILNSSTVL